MKSLDILKKGNESLNIKAREAIRYLEQRLKYKTRNLVAQRLNETTTVSIPAIKEHRDMLSCALYYRNNVVRSAMDSSDTPLIIVSDILVLGETDQAMLRLQTMNFSTFEKWHKRA
jgi:uncharacterized protein YfaS (alpha-2-macroglobulin family)